MCPCSCCTECYCAALILFFFPICCLHSKRLYFVLVMSEFWLLGSRFQEQPQLIYNVGHCRSTLGLLPLVCVCSFALVPSDFIFPLPCPPWVPLKALRTLSELELNNMYTCIGPFVCLYIHLSIFLKDSAALHILPQVSSFLWKLTTYPSSLFSTSERLSKAQPLSDPITIVTAVLSQELGQVEAIWVLLDAHPQISCPDTRHLLVDGWLCLQI